MLNGGTQFIALSIKAPENIKILHIFAITINIQDQKATIQLKFYFCIIY